MSATPEYDRLSIELKANPEGMILDVYAHTDTEWWNLHSYARTWCELGMVCPSSISEQTTLWSDLFDVESGDAA